MTCRIPEGVTFGRNEHGDVVLIQGDDELMLDAWMLQNCAPGTDYEILQNGAGGIVGIALQPPTSYSVPDTATASRRFRLFRHEDVSEVSGTGVIAHGVQFPDGHVALRWAIPGKPPSTAIWESIEAVEAIHGHQGKTEVEWID